MKIVICASIVFSDKIIEVTDRLEKEGHKVDIPYVTKLIKSGEISLDEYIKDKEESGDTQFREKYAEKADMIKRYYNLIKNSDAILVLNYDKRGVKNYVGGSVLMEMGFAYVMNQKIYLLNPTPDMIYTTEIVAMKPIILNGDLMKIK